MQNLVTYGKNSQRVYSDTNRTEDGNRFLTITDCVLTAEAVNFYSGSQIAEREKYNLDIDKKYAIYRPLEEIEKAKESFNLLPLTDDHIPISPERPEQNKVLGTIGESCKIENGQLLNTVAIWNGKGKQYIEDADQGKMGGKKDLSCGYAYTLIKESGIFDGQPYDFKMVDLRGNHVALVEEGRVSGAMIADSNNFKEERIVKKQSAMSMLISRLMGDSKAKDNEQKMKDNAELVKSMKEIAGKDAAEFEGGQDEKGKTIMEMASKLHDMESEEAEDEEESEAEAKREEELKKKKAEDMEEPIAAKTIKEVEKSNKQAAEDSLAFDSLVNKKVEESLKRHSKIVSLCKNVAGQLSDNLAMDSNLDNIINETLKLKGVDYKGKSEEAKLAMLEVLATQSKPVFAMDSIKTTNFKAKANPSISDAMKGK
jgi:hypothetical protein